MGQITLKAARINAGLRQTDAARLIGKTKNTIAAWESGRRSPKFVDLLDLCRVYGIEIDDIFMPENQT